MYCLLYNCFKNCLYLKDQSTQLYSLNLEAYQITCKIKILYSNYVGKTKYQDDICSNYKLYDGRSIFYPAILSGNKEMIEYLQGYVHNSTEFLSKEIKNDNRGALEECIVRNNLTDLLNFLLKLKDTSPENQLPESVIAGICMR